MLERIANSRMFVSFVLATFTGALLLRFYPFPDSNLYLQYIAIRDPLIYGTLSGSYTLFLFTTPFFVYSAAFSGIYVFSFAHKRKQKQNSLPLYPDAKSRDELFLVIGEIHHPTKIMPASDPQWLTIPEKGLFTGIGVFGAVGTGKTTLLNILADSIPDDERILLIEDTAELNIRKSNLVRFETRREQAGLPAVTVRDLLKAALRHRPDRIIVGEVRGGEAFDLLQALNTGHAGSLCTLHANSARQAVTRFADCVLQSGIELPHRAIMANIGSAVDLLIHIGRVKGQRTVSEIVAVQGFDNETNECQFESSELNS